MCKEIQCALSRCTYQGQHEVEKGSATVEEDSQQCGNRGEEQAHIPAHNNPQGLQDLMERTAALELNLTKGVAPAIQCAIGALSPLLVLMEEAGNWYLPQR